MKNNFKTIHIGRMIEESVLEKGIDIRRICNFFKSNEQEVKSMYQLASLDSDTLLRWSKLLEYDFFRIYSQHLILYSPPSLNKSQVSHLPKFRKNIYTKELIDFILEQIYKGEKTKFQIIEEYGIPKTTLYKWMSKYPSVIE